MRIRKRPWHEELLQQPSVIRVDHPETCKGRWKEILNCEQLHVEIGAGKGDYCLQMAQLYPTHGFVAIEKQPLIASYILKKAAELPKNVRVIIQDAEAIESWFEPQEIDIIHLNFSDPWPKSRHHKHRLTTQAYSERYRLLLADAGVIQQKSDNRRFFEDSVVSFSQNRFILDELSLDFRHEEKEFDSISEYERRFMELGQPIYRAVWRKK